MPDSLASIIEQVRDARAEGAVLKIVGGNSKSFYGRRPIGEPLRVKDHCGVVNYQPEELVLTVRGGTSLAEIEAVLDKRGQCLSFEPPHFGGATIGGTLACNQSGPRRPWSGSVRDLVLGIRLLNGKGEHLRFGGQVMKNVAGYDVSRLQAGALGCLGVITEVSLKVMPKPAASQTVVIAEDRPEAAIEAMNGLSGQPLPLTGACWLRGQDTGRLYLRFEGGRGVVRAAVEHMSRDQSVKEIFESGDDFWVRLREHELSFFQSDETLWRFSVGPTQPLPGYSAGDWLIDWGGAQRWLMDSSRTLEALNSPLAGGRGHVCAFRHGRRDQDVFSPLADPLKLLHIRLKEAFDPDRIFNPGRLYPWL